jgi:hypothetical protein
VPIVENALPNLGLKRAILSKIKESTIFALDVLEILTIV